MRIGEVKGLGHHEGWGSKGLRAPQGLGREMGIMRVGEVKGLGHHKG